ncbi:hypothetical protein DSM110093_03828 (plasmid) [Sulfitobacter sp. DSM 110093]|nr:hypothetical protein DSM110093_03567 [Sulfitobacter sp. DSM 110093]UOA33993.1 hypothetical protein DSM110093_03828 [Sulfitobacter sp. DSM 110093]
MVTSHLILGWSHLIIAERLKPVETSTGSLGSTLTDQNTLSALSGSPTVAASRCQLKTSLCICNGQTHEVYRKRRLRPIDFHGSVKLMERGIPL